MGGSLPAISNIPYRRVTKNQISILFLHMSVTTDIVIGYLASIKKRLPPAGAAFNGADVLSSD
jgi:hypothetical protein